MKPSWRNVPPVWRWRAGLLLAALAVGVFLLLSPKPWVVAVKAGEKWDTLDYVHVYGWIAAALNGVILLGLAALCPWWTAPLRGERSTSDIQRSTPKWFWPVVFGAMIVTGLFSVPRLNDGFWDDEDLNIRTTLYGRFKQSGGEVEFRKFDWLETVYGYKKGPNSHTLFSICARACADAWMKFSPARGFPLVEWPFRVPSLIFGVLAVGAIAWMLADFGLPVAGAIAAVLLAIHPWHIRYAAELRGYSLMIFLVPVVLVFWRRAMVTCAWRWWLAYAAAGFSLVYCYPGAVFLLVVMNVIAIPLFFFGRHCAGPWLAQSGRWFFANSLAAMLAIQMMMPLFPQARSYFDHVASQGFVAGRSWMINTLCYTLGGAPWTKSGNPELGYPEWMGAEMQNPGMFTFAAVLAMALILLGAGVLLTRGWPSATLVAMTFLCPPITFLVATAQKFLLYECYVIYALPGVISCAAAGIYLVCHHLRKLPGGAVLSVAFAILVLGADFAYTKPFRNWLTSHPLQQMKESVIFSRGTLDPWAPGAGDILTASFCIPPYLYDARMDRLDTADQFIAELHRADREHKPLLLNIGMPWAAREYSPRMWAMFSNPELFEQPVQLKGYEPSLDRLIARYKPHSADRFDFRPFAGDER